MRGEGDRVPKRNLHGRSAIESDTGSELGRDTTMGVFRGNGGAKEVDRIMEEYTRKEGENQKKD